MEQICSRDIDVDVDIEICILESKILIQMYAFKSYKDKIEMCI